MTGEVVIAVGDGDAGLEVRVIGRAYPGGLGVFDDNWLLALVTARAGARTLRFDAFLRTADFASFRAELGELVAGRARGARYWPSAPWVGIRVSARDGGRYACDVYARDGGSERAMELDVALDRAGVERLAEQTARVVSAFPVLP